MGRANGIVLIGIGVVLLALAYTGRAQAVWGALTGPTPGSEPAQPAPAEPPPAAGAADRTYTGLGPAGFSEYVRV